MDNTTKQQITDELRNYVGKFESQNKAVGQLRNVSVATVSNILHSKELEKISPEMWRNIAKQIGVDNSAWNIVETTNYRLLTGIFHDSALYSNVFGVIGDASVGKTETAKNYAATHANTYFIRCDEFWNRRTFVAETLKAMNQDGWGYTLPDMMDNIVKNVLKAKNPVFIFDEIDKVHDSILCSIISIYNRLEGYAGLVLMSTDHFERRLDKGLRLNKRGYKELHSRLGKKLIPLDLTSRADIEAIINANGITDEMQVAEIFNNCENDLRRVKRLVHKFKMKGGK